MHFATRIEKMIAASLERLPAQNSLNVGLHTREEGAQYCREIINRLDNGFTVESLNVAERYMK